MDISTVKQKRKEVLENNDSNNDSDIWKPPKGKSEVRIVPNKFDKDNPFDEVFMHWGIGGNHVLCKERTFEDAEDCPICSLATELYRNDNEEDSALAKKLFSNNSFYAPVIVRGKEEEGVKYWRFGVNVFDSLTEPVFDGDVGDFTDIEEGYDVKVKKQTPSEAGNKYGRTTARLARKKSPLLPDDKASEELIEYILDESQQPIEEVLSWAVKTNEEMKAILRDWIEPDNDEEENDTEDEEEIEEEDDEEIMDKIDSLMDD